MLTAYGTNASNAKKNGAAATASATVTTAAATVTALPDADGGDVGSSDQSAASASASSAVSLSAFADYAHQPITNNPASPSSAPSQGPGLATTSDNNTSMPTASMVQSSSSTVPTMGSGDATGASSAGVTSSAAPASASVPSLLKRTNKAKRLADGGFGQWPQPPEDPSDAELEALRTVWEPLMSVDLAALVFPNNKGAGAKAGVRVGQPPLANQDACLAAVTELTNQVSSATNTATQQPVTSSSSAGVSSSIVSQHSDLLVRYACHALCLRETAGGLLKVRDTLQITLSLSSNSLLHHTNTTLLYTVKVLGLVCEIFSMLKREGQTLHDVEASCLLPHLIDRLVGFDNYIL